MLPSTSPATDFAVAFEPDFSDDVRVALDCLYRLRDECYDLESPLGLQVRFALEQLIGAVADGSPKITVTAL
jgi:hypothetical protein